MNSKVTKIYMIRKLHTSLYKYHDKIYNSPLSRSNHCKIADRRSIFENALAFVVSLIVIGTPLLQVIEVNNHDLLRLQQP